MHRFDAILYIREYKKQVNGLRLKYTDDSVCRYLSMTESIARHWAIDLCTNEKVPLGRALTRSTKENATLWSTLHHMLEYRAKKDAVADVAAAAPLDAARAQAQSVAGSSAEPARREPPAKLPPPPKLQRPEKEKGSFQQSQKAGFCRAWNSRKCRNANCRFPHKCNVVIKGGKVCGAADHGAPGHSEAKHGAALRS